MSTTPKVIGDFIIEEEIGRGSFATVYKGFNRRSGLNVAVKVIHKEKLGPKLLQNLEVEINILRDCCHENVVKLLVAKKTENNYYLIMEYCSGGDFAMWLKKRKVIKEADARYYLKQLANGLSFMHSKKLIHRDLKPQNLLLIEKDKDYCCLKIADFGFAKHLNTTASLASTVCGSPLYMAPEILTCEKYDAKADLWSLGIILYEMIWGRPPFRANNHIELARKLMQKQELKFPVSIQIAEKALNETNNSRSSTVPINVSNECKDLLSKLLQVNPKERISFEEFFTHPFFDLPMEYPILHSQSKPIPSGNSLNLMNEEEDFAASLHSSPILRLTKDCKWAHFLVLIFEETNNIFVLYEIAKFSKSSIQFCIENKEALITALKWLFQTFQWCLSLLDRKQSNEQFQPVNVNNLVMQKTIEIARNGAVQESLGYNQSALHLYEVSLFLFQGVQEIARCSDFQAYSDFEFLTEKCEFWENSMLQRFEFDLRMRITHLKHRK